MGYREEGNRLVGEGRHKEAIEKYTAAIANGEDVAKCSANRATCHAHQGEWQQAAEDAKRALAAQPCYPRALAILGRATMNTSPCGPGLLSPLLSAVALNPSFAKELEADLVKVREVQLQMAHAVLQGERGGCGGKWKVVHCVSDGPRCGRRLEAAERIDVGEVVLPEQIPVAVGEVGSACVRCGREADEAAAVRCDGGCGSLWCGAEHKREDAALHRLECRALSTCAVRCKGFEDAADAFGVPASAIARNPDLSDEEQQQPVHPSDISSAASLLISTVCRFAAGAAGAATPWNFADTLALEGREDTLSPSACSRGLLNVQVAGMCTEILEEAVSKDTDLANALAALRDRIDWLGNDPHDWLGALCKHMMAVIQTNSFEVSGEEGDVVSMVLEAPPLSWCNHSCLPNAVRDDRGCIRAVSPILPGEEICIAYIADLVQPREFRREELRKLYTFECACRLCKGDAFRPLVTRSFRCKQCRGWVSFGDGCAWGEVEVPDVVCLGCGAANSWSDYRSVEKEAAEKVGHLVPLLRNGLGNLGGVDDELLGELEEAVHRFAQTLHPLHWVLHNASSCLGPCLQAMNKAKAAAGHALLSLAAMELVLPDQWAGKAERALAVLHLSGGSSPVFPVCMRVPDDLRAWLVRHYSSDALRDTRAAQAVLVNGPEPSS